jgi:hypothetical protein
MLMLHLMQTLSWRVGVLTGLVAGFAHLTKACVLPGLVLFLVLGT